MEPTLSEFTIMFAIATTGMLMLALAIVFFVMFYQKKMLAAKLKQQELEADYQHKMQLASLESQEGERRRLASDLHDSIGAMLSTVRVSLSTMIRQEKVNPDNISQTKQMLDDTIESVRRISRDLMPSTLEKFGLHFALKEMCEQYASVSGIAIHFEENGEIISIEKSKEVMVFRIIQEFINNSLKHAQPKCITIKVNYGDRITVAIADDGVGFDIDQKKQAGKGLGLFNMENRARLIHADFHYASKPGEGTRATLSVPI
jgi:two-component system, NarL family, sensor kinase